MLSTSLMLPGSEFTESDPEEIKDRLEKLVDLIIHGGYLASSRPRWRFDRRFSGGVAKASVTLNLSYKGANRHTTRP
jgi:hypothetical protein